MAKKKLKIEEIEIEETTVQTTALKPEEAVKHQTHCKCGANLATSGWVENNYKRFCSPACAA